MIWIELLYELSEFIFSNSFIWVILSVNLSWELVIIPLSELYALIVQTNIMCS